VKLRKSRARRKGRIEIIPMIDVMFFLLATFLLASLSLQNLHSLAVDLPRGSTTPLQAKEPVTLTVTRGGDILLNRTPVTIDDLAKVLQPMLSGPDSSVVIAADNGAANGTVVQAMLRARDAGAEHFVIAIKRE
jgi:biopolymer transport protein ExbD